MYECEERAATEGRPYNNNGRGQIPVTDRDVWPHFGGRYGQRSSHFRVVADSHDAKYILDLLEHDRLELLQRVSNAGIDVRLPVLEIVFNATTGDFVARTGMPSWASAATRKNKIELQPLALLKQRRILETTLRHELAHALIDTLGNGQTPRWLAEGMAIYLSGEGSCLSRQNPHPPQISNRHSPPPNQPAT